MVQQGSWSNKEIWFDNVFLDFKLSRMIRNKKGHILRKGESQRTDGRYMYRYMDCSGKYQILYSWRFVETDPHPKGKRQEDALRTKEEQIEENNRDLISNIFSSMTLN